MNGPTELHGTRHILNQGTAMSIERIERCDARVEAAIEAWFAPCADMHDFKARMTRALAAADAVGGEAVAHLELFKEAGEWAKIMKRKITPDMVELLGWLTDAANGWAERVEATRPAPAPAVAWAISYDGKTPHVLWTEGDGALLDAEVARLGGTACKIALCTHPAPAVPEGYALVPVEPRIGPEYEAGNWSRRNWEAALRDQAGAAPQAAAPAGKEGGNV